jgi:hypothetical protein
MADDIPGLLGYPAGLTPDQIAMIQQQGFYPQPTMSLPTGTQLQQPAGYSGLSPAQAETVNQLGYYTGSQQPQSLWDKITASLGGDALKGVGDAAKGFSMPQARPNLAPAIPAHAAALGGYNPYNNLYTRHPLDPKRALAALLTGNPYG